MQDKTLLKILKKIARDKRERRRLSPADKAFVKDAINYLEAGWSPTDDMLKVPKRIITSTKEERS